MAKEALAHPLIAPLQEGESMRAALDALQEASASLRVPLPRRDAVAVRRLSAELDRQAAAAGRQ